MIALVIFNNFNYISNEEYFFQRMIYIPKIILAVYYQFMMNFSKK